MGLRRPRSRSARRRSAPPTSRRTRRTSPTRRRRCRSRTATCRTRATASSRSTPRSRSPRRTPSRASRPSSVKGYWTINIQDATPGLGHQPRRLQQRRGHRDRRGRRAAAPAYGLDADRRRPRRVLDRRAAATWASVRAESKGYERAGYNKPMLRAPVRQRLRARADRGLRRQQRLHPGRDLAWPTPRSRPARPALMFGDVEFDPDGDADLGVGDPATPGFYTNQNGQQKARGVRGRFGFDFTAAAGDRRRAAAVPVRRRPRCRRRSRPPRPRPHRRPRHATRLDR